MKLKWKIYEKRWCLKINLSVFCKDQNLKEKYHLKFSLLRKYIFYYNYIQHFKYIYRLRRSLSRQWTININNSYCDNHPLKGSYYKNRNISGCIKPITQIPLDRMLSIKQKLRLILPKITKSSESKLSPKRKMKKGSQISTLS